MWYGKSDESFGWDENCYQNKSKQVSIVLSDKTMYLIGDSLEDYRYSIIIENAISDYFFTEKITNCFASQTIPIYLATRKINDFFNEDRIVSITEGHIEAEKIILKEYISIVSPQS